MRNFNSDQCLMRILVLLYNTHLSLAVLMNSRDIDRLSHSKVLYQKLLGNQYDQQIRPIIEDNQPLQLYLNLELSQILDVVSIFSPIIILLIILVLSFSLWVIIPNFPSPVAPTISGVRRKKFRGVQDYG